MRDKEGIESLCEREHHTKRFKAHGDCTLALMGLLLTDTANSASLTKWDVGEGKANTPEDSSHRQKELSSCEDVVCNNFPSFGE